MYSFLMRSIDFKRFVILTALLTWCFSLIALRVEKTGSRYFVFLIWNLFLAGIPLAASTALRAFIRLRWPTILQAGCFVIWLLFLPNAPYIVTDLQHLSAPSPVPTWYDLALLISCAGTGLLFGYLSLVDVHGIIARKFGVIMGWMLAIASLVLSGFALFLGRFLRWNSWDPLVSPGLFFDIADALRHPIAHTRLLSVTFVFGTMLALAYVAIRVLLAHPLSSEARLWRDEKSRPTEVG